MTRPPDRASFVNDEGVFVARKLTVYEAEKRLPRECPSDGCGQIFFQEGDDYRILSRMGGELTWGDGAPRAENMFDIIECSLCGARTMSVRIESRSSTDRAAIQRLIEHLGFVNPVTYELVGDPEELKEMGNLRVIHVELDKQALD